MVDGRNYFHFHLVAACVYRTDPKGGFGRAIKVFSVFVDIAKFDNSALATTVTESDVQ